MPRPSPDWLPFPEDPELGNHEDRIDDPAPTPEPSDMEATQDAIQHLFRSYDDWAARVTRVDEDRLNNGPRYHVTERFVNDPAQQGSPPIPNTREDRLEWLRSQPKCINELNTKVVVIADYFNLEGVHSAYGRYIGMVGHITKVAGFLNDPDEVEVELEDAPGIHRIFYLQELKDMGDSNLTPLERKIQHLHRRQVFYKEHSGDLPTW